MSESYLLHPATFKLDGGAMFGIIPKPLWEKQRNADEFNRIDLSLRLWLIKSASRVVIVDTGIGDYHDPKFQTRFAIKGGTQPLTHLLQTELQMKPQDVTDVIITHLHFDHVGGLGESHDSTQTPVFPFPRARVHIHRQHYNYALAPTVRDQGSFQSEIFHPMIEKLDQAERVVWHQGEAGTLISDNEVHLSYRISHGHTPFLMHPYNHKFIYMADLVPTVSHVPLPWVMGYDIYPGQTVKDKAQFYDFIAEKNLTMIFEHDTHTWGSQVRKNSPHDYEATGLQKIPLPKVSESKILKIE